MSARDPDFGPVPDSAWAADAAARKRGRVEIFNATRPGGIDNWTMDLDQYELMRRHILSMIDEESDEDGRILLKDVAAAAQERYATHELFPRAGSATTARSRRSISRRAARSNASPAGARSASVGLSRAEWVKTPGARKRDAEKHVATPIRRVGSDASGKERRCAVHEVLGGKDAAS